MTDTYNESTILAYVEGELSPEDQHAFKLGMLKDAKLRKLVEQLVADRAALRQMPLEPVPVALVEQVDQYLERNMLLGPAPAGVPTRVQAERRFQFVRTSSLMAIAAVLVLGVGLFVWQTWTEMHQFTQIDLVAMQPQAASPKSDIEAPADTSAEPLSDNALAMADADMKDVSEERLAKVGRTPPPPAAAFERKAADVIPMPEEPAMDDWVDRQLLPEIGEALDALRRDYKSPVESLAAAPLELPKMDLARVGVAKDPSEPLVADEFDDADQFVQAKLPEIPVPVEMAIAPMPEEVAVTDEPVADIELDRDTQLALSATSARTSPQVAGEAAREVNPTLAMKMTQLPSPSAPATAKGSPVPAQGKGAAIDMRMPYKAAAGMPEAAAKPLRAGEQPTAVRLTIVTYSAERSRRALTDWAKRRRVTIRVEPKPLRGKGAYQIDTAAPSAARSDGAPAIGGPGQARLPRVSPEPVEQLTLYIKAGQLRHLIADAKRNGEHRTHLALVPVLLTPKSASPITGVAATEKLQDTRHPLSEQREASGGEQITLVNPLTLVRTDSKPMTVIVTIVPR